MQQRATKNCSCSCYIICNTKTLKYLEHKESKNMSSLSKGQAVVPFWQWKAEDLAVSTDKQNLPVPTLQKKAYSVLTARVGTQSCI